MMKNKIKIIIVFLVAINLSTIGKAMDRPPKDEGPTAIVIDDETGKPIEGAVAIAIWRDDKDVSLINALHGGGAKFKKAEEVVSDKDGKISIPDFWKTTKGKGGTGSIYDPRLTIYKFGYVCWDQQEIFAPDYKWTKRTDFNRDNRIVRLKKWPVGFLFREHAEFKRSVTNGNYSISQTPLFIKAFEEEGPGIIQEVDKKYLPKKK
jgi:hypothetical protein